MSKDPAFLFYPNDWLGETLGMTFEQKGAYLELLMLQFNRGHMAMPLIRQVVGQLWEAVQCHFEPDEQGLYFNLRLDEEVQRRRSYSASRRKNMRGVQQNESDYQTHMYTHMETETVTEAETDLSGTGDGTETGTEAGTGAAKRSRAGRFVPPTREEVAEYCAERGSGVNPQRFVDFYASKGWMVGKSPMRDWRAAVRSWDAGAAAERGSGQPKPITGIYCEVI